MAQGCCGCCSALRPRYKRLVDNIFPHDPQDGLVKSNMEKLTFYSLSSPEKLDRIGEYLFQKASRDIDRRKHGLVIIAMEAMDQLLLACHSQTLNLFVESFLKMVQKLLESADPQLQILSTQSFVRFANIEEATPSYHRRYDFFVSKFSAMCHSNHKDVAIRDKIRLAGIRGLQGVIRKTVADDLVENIWEAEHMDKIVPSLLYNMQSAEKYETLSCVEQVTEEETDIGSGPVAPPTLAEACLRELVGRASFGHIRSVLRPVLTHFDRHELWVPTEFAVYTFKIIMFSIQAQYSYSVLETLMQHVEAGGRGAVRAARAAVLTNIVAIAAADSVGPSVLEIINNLLTNLRASVARDLDQEDKEEQMYKDALINALGEFADHLPDFQKIDIMMFIISKIPQMRQKPAHTDLVLLNLLLKSLLKVGSTYKSREYSKAFPSGYLDSLLRLCGVPEPAARATLQRILHTLLDRHGNAATLSICSVNVSEMDLTMQKCSRQDLIFIHKQSFAIYSSLYEGLQFESNTVENVETIYTTLAILCVELICEETVCDFVQLVLTIQTSALTNPVLTRAQRYQLVSVCVALMALLTRGLHLPVLREYINNIIESRQKEAPHLLPSLLEEYEPLPTPNNTPHLLIDQLAVVEGLRASGVDGSRVQSAAPYAGSEPSSQRSSWLHTGAVSGRDSLADITAAPVNSEMDSAHSAHSSPGLTRSCQYEDLDGEYRTLLQIYHQTTSSFNFCDYKLSNEFWCWGNPHDGDDYNVTVSEEILHPQSDGVSVEAWRRVAAGPSDAERRDAERRRASLHAAFRDAPFSHLVRLTAPKYEIQDKLEEIFNSLSAPESDSIQSPNKYTPTTNYQKQSPELFLY